MQEEREAKGKMPTYKGLENFRLIDKMGECVHHIDSDCDAGANRCHFCSGAFSNVYKAVDIHTGQRVAGKSNISSLPGLM